MRLRRSVQVRIDIIYDIGPSYNFLFPNRRKRTVAIVVPSKAHVEALANRIGMATESFEQLCSNAKVCQAVLDSLNAGGSQAGAI